MRSISLRQRANEIPSDARARVVVLGGGVTAQELELPFEHLVVALGNVTDFRGIPGRPDTRAAADAARARADSAAWR